VGQDTYEEVDLVQKGLNYGWAYYEALTPAISLYPSQTTLLINPPPSFTNTAPLWFYPHTAIGGGDPNYKGNSISGGVVYRGSRIPELTGAYIFGDFESANIWALRRTNSSVSVQRIAGVAGAAAFGHDPANGDLLIANYAFNKVQRLVKMDAANASFPTKLSDTGIFADLATLAPNPGIVNYEPIVPFWSDYAVKRRWFCVPDMTNTVSFVADGNWTFPSGMKWIKHFDLELERGNPATRKRIETRVLTKIDTGAFGVSYAWNDAGSEAYLVPDAGTNFNINVLVGSTIVTQQVEIPSRAACLICHTPVGGHALSFNTREMNQSAALNGFSGNQLALLGQAGYFNAPVPAPQTLPAFATATDASRSLESRVRSYLAVNCIQCHQPGGSGASTWNARPEITLAQTGLINGEPDNNGANPLNKLVVPGDTTHSVLLQRILGNGFTRMPPLATHQLDQGAINLLTTWISSDLTNRQSFAQWQIANFGSTNNPSAAANADPDNDGANNFYEFLTKTLPLTDTPPPWTITMDEAAGTVGVNFLRLANLGFLVETSTNFAKWSAWDVPGNQLFFGASNIWTTVSGQRLASETNRFFRVKILEP
jgi:mono/diheme cytochrome c family protein